MLGGIKWWTLEFCMPLAIVVDGMHEVQANVDGSIEITIPKEASACNAVAAANASLGNVSAILPFPRIFLHLSGWVVATTAQFGGVMLHYIHNRELLCK
jgi:hypothetical protein